MAFSEISLGRIRKFFQTNAPEFLEIRMFSGVCIKVDDKMCCGTHIDKKTGVDYLLCRLGEEDYLHALQQEHVIPMEFTGKPMKGYIFVTEEGFASDRDLAGWLQKCLDFNPLDQSSKSKKKRMSK